MYTLRCKIFNINPETLATKDIQSFSHKMEPITLSTTITRTTKYSIPIHHKDVKLYDTPSYYIHLGFHFIRAKKKRPTFSYVLVVILIFYPVMDILNSVIVIFRSFKNFFSNEIFIWVRAISRDLWNDKICKSKNIFLFV